MTVCLLVTPAWAWENTDVEFNADFLKTPVDLRLFARGNPVPPGRHRVELVVNGEWWGRRVVRFESPASGDQVAHPCFDDALLSALGFAMDESRSAVDELESAQAGCSLLEERVPGAVARYDASLQQLDLQVPQAVLRRQPGETDPSTWEGGVTAATLQYDYTGYKAEAAGTRPYTSHYLGLRSGLAWGRWRGRIVGALSAGSEGLQYSSRAAQVETALPGWRSRLVLGDANTEGRIFEGLNLRGIQLGSDARMLPDGARELSPRVRGVARSNALVAVRQQQGLVYQVAVPPGPFVLEDLPVAPHGGDLQVTVTEADGGQQSFSVFNSPSPEALPPGRLLYSLAWGVVREPGGARPWVLMATGRHGMSDRATVFGGLLAAAGYQSAAAGLALNTGWGSVSAAWVHARSTLPGGARQSGDRLSFQQAKYLPGTRTSLSFSGQWDVNRGFVGPSLALARRAVDGGIAASPWLPPAPAPAPALESRARLWLSASQGLGNGWGAFAMMASAHWRWGESGAQPELLFNYARQAGWLDYGLTVSRTQGLAGRRMPLQVSLTLSMPLEGLALRPRLATTAAGGSTPVALNTSLSGSAGEDQALSYSTYLASQATAQEGNGVSAPSTRSGGALLNWAAPQAQLGASLSAGSGGARQYSARAAGAVVVYAGGLVWARELGETLAIVEARHAGGARVAGWAGLRLDAEGRGVVPHLLPYRTNEVGVDPQGLPPGIGILGGFQKVVPASGAVVLLRFETEAGHSLLASGRLASGQPLPFGARVLDAAGRSLGHVAQGGQALLRLAEPQGRLSVEWGEAQGQRCSFDYAVPLAAAERTLRSAVAGLPHLDVMCL